MQLCTDNVVDVVTVVRHDDKNDGKSKEVLTAKQSLKIKGKNNKNAGRSLKDFSVGATPARFAQIDMIKKVFHIIDSDGDNLLSFADVKAYFRSLNRPSDDLTVRKWIRSRDIDQDGAVSLAEFIASFGHQFDASDTPPTFGKSSPVDVATAFGMLRIGNSPAEISACLLLIEDYIQRIIDSPGTQSFWRISVSDPSFSNRIGRLVGGVKLMEAFGFVLEQNGSVLALSSNDGTSWTTVPSEFRQVLSCRLEELKRHKESLLYPTISNLAAGSHTSYICL